MRSIAAVLALLPSASVCIAAISGTVVDTAGRGISGAAVKLERGGQASITDGNGGFTIPTVPALVHDRIDRRASSSVRASVHGGLLSVFANEESVVKIGAFDLRGRESSTMQLTVGPGESTMRPPQHASGVYLCKIDIGGTERILKYDAMRQSSIEVADFPSTREPLRKEARASAALNDVLLVTKSGLLNHRLAVMNADTSGMRIRMIPAAGTVTDVDGNVYQTVKIGKQEWMAENLRTTRYADGTAIPFDTSSSWGYATTPKYCYYGNMSDPDTIKKYGALYNWYVAASTHAIAPAGWHVPSDSEWTVLQYYLVLHGYNYDGTTDTSDYNGLAKSLSEQADWFADTSSGAIGNDVTKNNASGFSAVPVGYRDRAGLFYGSGRYALWWSSNMSNASFPWSRNVYYARSNLGRDNKQLACNGLSVRLVKD